MGLTSESSYRSLPRSVRESPRFSSERKKYDNKGSGSAPTKKPKLSEESPAFKSLPPSVQERFRKEGYTKESVEKYIKEQEEKQKAEELKPATPGKDYTTREQFAQYLFAKRGQQYEEDASTGRYVVAPSTALINLSATPTLEQQSKAAERQQRKQNLNFFVGMAETEMGGQKQLVAVPSAGADAKRKTYYDLTGTERANYLKSVIGKGDTYGIYDTTGRIFGNRIVFSDNLNVLQPKSEEVRLGESGFLKTTGKKYASKIYEIGKGTLIGAGKFIYAPNYPGMTKKPVIDIGQGKLFKTQGNVFLDTDVQTFGTVVGLVGLGTTKIGGTAIRWAFRGGAGYYGSKFITNPTAENLAETAFYLTPDILGKGKKAFQSLNQLFNPKYVPYNQAGVQVVEGTTIPTTTSKLLKFEGKTVPSAHTTLSGELKPGTVIKPADLSRISGWRKALGQRSFYTSSPQESSITKAVYGRYNMPKGLFGGAKQSFEATTFKEAGLSTRYEPVLYGGYIGLGKLDSASNVEYSLLPKGARAFIFRETEISKTPRALFGKSAKEIISYQTTTPGTYVAGENIKGISTEGQFTTSPGTEGKPLIRIAKADGALSGKFTYYTRRKDFPILKDKAPKALKGVWDFFTSEKVKIKFFETKFEKIGKGLEAPKTGKELDIGKYSSSYGTVYKSVSSIYSKTAGLSSLIGSKSSKKSSSNLISSFSSASSTKKSSSSARSGSSSLLSYSPASSGSSPGSSTSSVYSGSSGSSGSSSSGSSASSFFSSGSSPSRSSYGLFKSTTGGFLLPNLQPTVTKKKKKGKGVAIFGRYQPQLRSAGQEIYGKPSDILTGIGFERPISKRKKLIEL